MCFRRDRVFGHALTRCSVRLLNYSAAGGVGMDCEGADGDPSRETEAEVDGRVQLLDPCLALFETGRREKEKLTESVLLKLAVAISFFGCWDELIFT